MTRLCLACGKEKTLDRFPSTHNTSLICEECAKNTSLAAQNLIKVIEEPGQDEEE